MEADKGDLEQLIHTQLDAPHWVNAVARDLFLSGGKRLRSRLTLSMADTFDVPRSQALPWAAANEILHNASLVHDDIQDKDEFRRGRRTMWAEHGLEVAISVGDYLLMKPFSLISAMPVEANIRVELCHMVSETVSRMAVAQIKERELKLQVNQPFLKQRYLDVISGKTSALFELPVAGLSLLAGRSESERRQTVHSFELLGQAFQIWDDLKDALGLKEKPAPGEDLREGKVTALVVMYGHLRPERLDDLAQLLQKPERSSEEVALWLEEFKSSQVLEHTRTWLESLWSEFEAALPEALLRSGLAHTFGEWMEIPTSVTGRSL